MRKLLTNRLLWGAVCILLAAAVAFLLLPRFYASQSRTCMVLRASTKIPAGTILTKSMLTTAEVGAYGLSEEVVQDFEDAVGKVALTDIYGGETLWAERLAEQEAYLAEEAAKSRGLTAASRLVTVELPGTAAGLAGILRSGDTVDAYECSKNETGNYVSEKALTNLEIYEVLNRDLQALDDLEEKQATAEEELELDMEPLYVTFRCTEAEAETLIRLEREESLHLVLKGGT